jgi:septation ring formation regulator EzrA
MAQEEPNFDYYDRQLRHINRRLERLEDTQVSPQELTRGLDRVYLEIDELRQEVREVKISVDELNRKFDVIMQYITGSNSES